MDNALLLPNRKQRYWGWHYLIFCMVFLPSLLAIVLNLLRLQVSTAQENAIFFFINFAAVLWIFREFLVLSIHNLHRVIPTVVGFYILYYIALAVMGMALRSLVPEYSNANDSNIQMMTRDNYPLMAFCTVILVPITEECLHRGAVFGSLFIRNKILAYVLSTVVFSLVHIIGYIEIYSLPALLIAFVQYIPAGICLAGAYHLSGSIYAPIILHILINGTGMLALR